jgi:DNA recombination protein RmuC
VGDLLIGLLIGAALGALVVAVVIGRRDVGARADGAAAQAEVAAARARSEELSASLFREREALEQERTTHAQALAAMSDRFKSLAGETLLSVVDQYQKGQVETMDQREAKLDERLQPLSELLKEYRDRVELLERNREKGFTEVSLAAERLLQAQRDVTEETKKLNTILGRSDARGRWGEIQLQRILEIAGMTEYVDFDTQSTVTTDEGRSRPDVVVHLPQGAVIAIDAKTPFDAFDRAMSADSDVAREAALKEYASNLRSHVNDLRRKEYWSKFPVAPAFVVCFVPSDHLLSAAFEADHTLLDDALQSKVLVAGPTTLLGLLWSVALGWSQFKATENFAEIQDLASRLVDRTSKLFDHVSKLGRGLDSSVKNFNGLVGSLESSLLVTVRDLQRHGVRSQREIESIEDLPQLTRPPARDRGRDRGRSPQRLVGRC